MKKSSINISVKNLTIGYHSKVVSSNINLSLKKGELCAIIGVNGSGKSTLLRTLANLQPKLDGEITLQTKDLGSTSARELSKLISVVLTESIASKNLTVEELITLGRQPYTNWIGALTNTDRIAVQNSISKFELEEFKPRKCHELSDGQLQRGLIARAMAQDTPLILLDEPTTHLDLYHKVQILKLLKQLVQEHQKTILFTTHEIDLAIQLADKILILDQNKNFYGNPCKLIELGAFNQLFPKDMVKFDTKTGSFKVNN